MFKRIEIIGLRGVGRVELSLVEHARVCTLFGTNGVGKTKCLEALYQFFLLSNSQFVSEQHGAQIRESFPVMQSVIVDGFSLSIPDTPKLKLDQSWTWSPRPLEATQEQFPVVFLGAANRSSVVSERDAPDMLGTFSSRRRAYFASIINQMNDGQHSSIGMSEDVSRWFVLRAQSANPYQESADNRQVEVNAVLSMLNAIDPRIDKAFLQIDGSGAVALRVDGQVRRLGELSSGFASLVKLVQAIIAGYSYFTNEVNLRDVRGIVLIDEIESHLHVGWQAHVVGRLKELLPNTFFFIATHSPLVLARLAEGEAYLLEKDADGVVRSQVIDSPNKRAFVDVLQSGLGVDLNALKLQSLEADDQSAAKKAMLEFLNRKGSASA
ncbi:AAA family ATPase [Ramlibacter sp.]|uniref:AAA family ATPase n=1 Tax=Ramlibacter sp. TaxID=1917967 RepID=UPI003D1492D3